MRSSVRGPQPSVKTFLKTSRMPSTTGPGSRSPMSSGLRPTGFGSAASITIIRPAASFGARATMESTNCRFGSMSTSGFPALMSESARCAKISLLPEPVPPVMAVCSNLSTGVIPMHLSTPCAVLRANTDTFCSIPFGGASSLGCRGGSPGSSRSSTGHPMTPTNCGAVSGRVPQPRTARSHLSGRSFTRLSCVPGASSWSKAERNCPRI